MKTWIKFYTESIHDRKLWKLKPVEQLAFFYLCAIAGIEDNGGALPSVDDIELELQMPLKLKRQELDRTMSKLESMGLLSKGQDNVWIVTNYEKRQMSNMTEAERKALYRDKKKTLSGQMSDECPDIVRTDVQKMSHIEEEVEIDKEEDKELREVKECVLKNAPTKKTPAKPKPEKHTYGSFGNVLLTDAEAESLRKKFTDADNRIEYFSTKKKAKGYVYKSDYAAILAWADDDAEKKKAKPAQTAQPKPQTQPEDWMAIADRIMAQDAVMGGLQ